MCCDGMGWCFLCSAVLTDLNGRAGPADELAFLYLFLLPKLSSGSGGQRVDTRSATRGHDMTKCRVTHLSPASHCEHKTAGWTGAGPFVLSTEIAGSEEAGEGT